jgi:hypothetical protein
LIGRVEQWNSDETTDIPGILPRVDIGHSRCSSRHPQVPIEKGLCNAGVTYANVNVAGDVKRCGYMQYPILGNIYQNTVSLFEAAQPCPHVCGCTEKYYCGG